MPDGKIKLPDFKTNMREAIGILHKGGLRMKPYGMVMLISRNRTGETVAGYY